jgi:hypothetical protein
VAAQRVDLYAGADLINAVARSVIVPDAAQRRSRASLPRFFRPIIDDALHAPVLKILPSNLLVTGRERISGASMRVLFRGQLRAVEFCAQHILGTRDFSSAPVRLRRGLHFDVAVFDHPLVDRNWVAARPCIRVPLWIGQRCKLNDTWDGTLQALPHALKKEIARLLRKHPFSVTTTSATAAKVDFYRRVYLPFIKQRFGTAANIRDERTFLRESRDAVLLQLFLAGRMTGATLVKRRGDTQVVDKTGLAPEHDVSGRSVVLDYFCFLLAQLQGCKWLDFGVSRPHLEDGVFHYKCKWRTELIPATAFKPAIRIRPVSRSPATMAFLSRNGFIERRGARYIVRRLFTTHVPTPQEVTEMDAIATRSGLDALIVALSGVGGEPRSNADRGRRTRISTLPDTSDPVQTFLNRV